MSQPNSYTSTTYSTTTATTATTTKTTKTTAGTTPYHKPLPQTRRRARSGSDEHMPPTRVFTAFVGGGNSNNTYTHSQTRSNSRSGHQALMHEHGRNAGAVVPATSKPTIPTDTTISNTSNYNNFHYRQKGQRQPASAPLTTKSDFGGETYYDLAEDSADDDDYYDDDVDRTFSEDGEDREDGDDLYGNHTRTAKSRGGSGAEGQQPYRSQFIVTQSKSVFGSEYSEGGDLDHESQSQRILQSRQSRVIKHFLHKSNSNSNGYGSDTAVGNTGLGLGTYTFNKTPPTTEVAQPITIAAGIGSSISVSHTHRNQANTNTYNRHHPSRHHLLHHPNRTNGQPQQQQHQYSSEGRGHSHSHRNGHGRGHGHGQGHRYNASRQLRQSHPHPPYPPRAASSSAFYNTNPQHSPTSPPTSPSTSPPAPARAPAPPPRPPSSSSSPSSRTWRASRPPPPPTAPPTRVSSLLPPPRSTTTTTTNASSRLPLSTFTVTTPITARAELPTPSTSTSNPKPTPNSPSDPVSTARARTPTSPPPPSNAILQEAPTHAQFASSFLDPLKHWTALPDNASAPASGTGAGFGSGAPRSGVGSGAGPGPDPGPPTRRPPHSRASSFGTGGDSLRNLNRWSSSTASSRLSTWDYHHYQQQQAQQQKSAAFARRMSVDSIGVLSQHPEAVQVEDSLPPNHYSSPRKLIKRRPSQSTSASPGSRARAGSGSAPALGLATGSRAIASTRRDPSPPPFLLPSSAPPPNLPPIISLSPLDPDPERSFRLGSPRAMSRSSPNLNTPNSVFASQPGNAEPQDYFWSDLSNPIRTASPAMRSNTTLLPPAPVLRDRDVVPDRRGHSRSRSAAKGGSGDSTKPKDRGNSKPSQKAMLAKALSKANTAVQLDNAQNYGAAKEAYLEACELLQQVLTRTNGDDDRKKLDAIRVTYTSRIEELYALVPVNLHEDKALPARPDSSDYHGVQIEMAGVDNQSDAATITRSRRDESPPSPPLSQAMRRPPEPITYRDFSRNADVNQHPRQSSISRSPMRRNFERNALTIPRSSDDSFLPAPLSPRRPASPPRIPSPEPIVRQDFSLNPDRYAVAPEFRSHRRNLSHESASWLDPIDESGGSTTSSVHSRSSSRIMRKHIRQPSGDTEAEFDAALDAAVEAAYDDGYEPMESSVVTYDDVDEDRIATSMRRVELAKERVRQTEREAAIEMARERERQRQMSFSQQSQTYGGDFFDANDSDEEEERMLEEMTRGYVMEDFSLGRQSRFQSSVPRESDSSGFTSRTWHSSVGSNPPTGTTTLSVVSEVTSSGNLRKTSSPPSMPPPTQSLPQPPTNRPPSITGVRNRRLSGQNAKQLKIETSKLGPSSTMPPPPMTTSSVVQSQPTSNYIAQQRQALSASSTRAGSSFMRAPSSPIRGVSPADAAGPVSPPGGHDDEVRTGSPSSILPGMHKNFSSSSLKSLKSRQMSLSHLDDADPLPMTPLTQQVSNSSVSRLPTMPALPTPVATTFAEKTVAGIGGLHLFDSEFVSPVLQSPNSTHHHQQNPDVPLPLEPCPSDPMFRPFWLMRALYQTLAHPRGGYISNRLFVPQDAWKVRGVKLRNIEDKISQCDLLTAALLTLARVDSTDADAMLDEMQVFENLLETVQATLSRRLGTEVGTQGIVTFKDEKEVEAPPVPRNNSISGKGGAFSWRRLRSKGSAVNLAGTYGAKANTSGGSASGAPGIPARDAMSPGGTMPSLPMVAHPSSRPAKRDVASVRFEGPNANYMASLARLFDAAQTVDQIARQVDDPGLRHADKTQVGLELCTRHAAEFFGFYICRFVLTDLGMLLDKFVKRGSEWVLS
ncbi:hypothetical protein F5Y12DRAFT_718763 [Xylaria sp. FL1777]|nr:hypothetical protein F5Y12DRAFT_718763 [Xylaria sp. FL1777]